MARIFLWKNRDRLINLKKLQANTMSLTRQQKEQTVAETQKGIEEAVSVAFVTFSGMNLEEGNELRDKLFAEGAHMRVMPKRLLKIVMTQAGLAFDPATHEGQMAVVWGNDAVAPAKTIHDFVKTREHIRLVAGVLEKNVLSTEEVLALAKLPSKQQLLGQLVGVLSGPMRGFASVLSGVQRQTVYVLTAIAEKKA